MEDKVEQSVTKFSQYRGKLKDLYSNDRATYNRAGNTSTLAGLKKVKTKDAETLYYEAIENPATAPDISKAAYYMSDAYATIINYYKTLFYIRYTIIPRFLEEKKELEVDPTYDRVYNDMVGAVEGINLETVLPLIAEETLIKGRCGVITEKNNLDSITSFILPVDRYKPIGKTQFGTTIIAFDYKYFDDMQMLLNGKGTNAVSGVSFDSFLQSMPKILQKGYLEYVADGKKNRWYRLEPKVSTQFDFNELALPPKLGAFPASVDYNSYKSIKLDTAAQRLDKILTHQIPTNSDGDIIMDVDEAVAIAKEIRNTVSDIENLKVVTTFGKTDLLNLQQNESDQVDVINTAYNNIYNSAGVDHNLFVTEKKLEVSIRRDKAFMWDFYQRVILFYNIAFNQLISFKPYQCRINLLPISIQEEEADVKRYLTYAGAGIGRLNAVIATGIKQVDLYANARVEKFLDLDNILVPLQSTYTSSWRANANIVSKKEEAKEQEQEQQEQEDQIDEEEVTNVTETEETEETSNN